MRSSRSRVEAGQGRGAQVRGVTRIPHLRYPLFMSTLADVLRNPSWTAHGPSAAHRPTDPPSDVL